MPSVLPSLRETDYVLSIVTHCRDGTPLDRIVWSIDGQVGDYIADGQFQLTLGQWHKGRYTLTADSLDIPEGFCLAYFKMSMMHTFAEEAYYDPRASQDSIPAIKERMMYYHERKTLYADLIQKAIDAHFKPSLIIPDDVFEPAKTAFSWSNLPPWADRPPWVA
jgi:hypothetical protein